MSAFVVSKKHIDLLVAAGVTSPPRYEGYKLKWRHDGEWHELTLVNAGAVGAMLWAENVTSVEYRYSPPGREAIYGEGWEDPDQELPGTYVTESPAPGVAEITLPEWVAGYRFALDTPVTSWVQVLKAISCYEYQSCEHDGWQQSEAKVFCDALRDHAVTMLPGWSDAAWSID